MSLSVWNVGVRWQKRKGFGNLCFFTFNLEIELGQVHVVVNDEVGKFWYLVLDHFAAEAIAFVPGIVAVRSLRGVMVARP